MERKGINEEKARGREKEEEIRHRDKALFQGIPWQREKRELIALACSACAVESAPHRKERMVFSDRESTRKCSGATIKNLEASISLTEINLDGVLEENCNKTRKEPNTADFFSFFLKWRKY
ncbi:hypothetical protein CDAR_311491 [Caerostris darwini]|uniref:Uncharacterized protein n=1 Tax=Caerostris darwini TaxID=1538125 RepID=A0AAV4UT21_9ARAC|nr:hypothetical protein CDAR_311491 [Caerostris darwini]